MLSYSAKATVITHNHGRNGQYLFSFVTDLQGWCAVWFVLSNVKYQEGLILVPLNTASGSWIVSFIQCKTNKKNNNDVIPFKSKKKKSWLTVPMTVLKLFRMIENWSLIPTHQWLLNTSASPSPVAKLAMLHIRQFQCWLNGFDGSIQNVFYVV